MNDDLQRKKSDYLLELALEEQLASDDEMNSYKIGAENPHKFSDEHNRKITEIIKRAEKVHKRGLHRRKHLQVAICLFIALSVSAVTVTRVEAFRLPLMRFFAEVRDKSTKFNLQGENNFNLTKNYQQYEPQYIPDGFSVLEVDEGKGTFFIKYVNDQKNQNYVFYFYSKIVNRELDTEDINVIKTHIGENEAFIIEKDNEIRVLMNKDTYQYYLQGEISVNEACKIMESLN